MATSYNPRSGSSGSHNNKADQAGNRSSKARRDLQDKKSNRPPLSFNRSKVNYDQSAKNDLAAQTPAQDPRNRYARFRSDQPVRVLGNPGESRFNNRSGGGDFRGTGGSRGSRSQGGSSGSGGSRGSGGSGGRTPSAYSAPGGFDSRSSGSNRSGRSNRYDRDGGYGYDSRYDRNADAPTVREYRERERQLRRQQSRTPRRILIAVICLIALLVIGFGVYRSPAFTIQTIEVEGTERLSSERLIALAAVPEESTLLRLDTKGIMERVKADPWVSSVQIRRNFPSSITIVVQERPIAAVVEVPGPNPTSPVSFWLISSDGFWLDSFVSPTTPTNSPDASGNTPDEGADASGNASDGAGGAEANGADGGTEVDPNAVDSEAGMDADATSASEASLLEGVHLLASELSAYPRINDVSRKADPQLAGVIKDEGVLNALSIINGFTPDMRDLIQSISAPDRVKTKLTLTNNVVVAFGAADDVEAKEKVILQLLSEYEGRLSYINVRVADHATVRAI